MLHSHTLLRALALRQETGRSRGSRTLVENLHLEVVLRKVRREEGVFVGCVVSRLELMGPFIHFNLYKYNEFKAEGSLIFKRRKLIMLFR